MLVTLYMTLSLVLTTTYSRQVTLNTRLCKITGNVADLNGTRVSKFLGIPYAKPPVRQFRFAKPQPFGPFRALNATSYGNSCMQFLDQIVGDEDCLTLNVFTPTDEPYRTKKSVMVWIHGGGYDIGDAATHPSEILSAFGDVVVVTVQYGPGVFGFQTTGNSILLGNLGLWDQRMALLWVKGNIDDYGGNSSSITIFGESSGGSAVAYHLFSQYNNASVFQRAIVQSPGVFTTDILNRDPSKLTAIFAESLNCSVNQNLVPCLQSKSATQLVQNYNKLPFFIKSFPIADGDFISRVLGYLSANFTENSRSRLEREIIGNFSDFDVFGGWNDQEGLFNCAALQAASNLTDLKLGVSDRNLMDAMKWFLPDTKYREFIIKTAKNYYMNNPGHKASSRRTVDYQRIEAFTAMTGDLIFKVPMIQWLQIHSLISNRSSFAYEYRVRRSNPVTWIPIKFYEGPEWLRVGANHADEVPIVFGFPFYTDFLPQTNSIADRSLRDITYTYQEKKVSRRAISIWANFPKYGNSGRGFEHFTYPSGQKDTMIHDSGLFKSSYPLDNELRLWTSLFTASQ